MHFADMLVEAGVSLSMKKTPYMDIVVELHPRLDSVDFYLRHYLKTMLLK